MMLCSMEFAFGIDPASNYTFTPATGQAYIAESKISRYDLLQGIPLKDVEDACGVSTLATFPTTAEIRAELERRLGILNAGGGPNLTLWTDVDQNGASFVPEGWPVPYLYREEPPTCRHSYALASNDPATGAPNTRVDFTGIPGQPDAITIVTLVFREV